MTTSRTILQALLGIVTGTCVQWLSLLSLSIFKGDILFQRSSYTSTGLAIFIVFVAYLLFQRKWWLGAGIIIGTLLWYPIFLELLALGGV